MGRIGKGDHKERKIHVCCIIIMTTVPRPANAWNDPDLSL